MLSTRILNLLIVLLSSYITFLSAGHVLELNDKFLELKGEIPWLVKFYAPWCGYCRRLEPIYEEVARRLAASSVKVARLDATVYPAVASAYEVRGYPTIKYIKGSHVETHYGDRSVDRIIQFVEKAQGPAMRSLNETTHFHDALRRHSSEPFFLYIGPEGSSVHEAFAKTAQSYHLKTYFYEGKSVKLLDENLPAVHRFLAKSSKESLQDDKDLVVVVKDDHIIPFTPDLQDSAASLSDQLRHWVNKERFPILAKLSEMDLYDFMEGGRNVALFVLNESRLIEASRNADRRIFQMAKKIAAARVPQLEELQFGYMVDHAAANSWAMTYLPTPNLIVVQPLSHQFYLREDYDVPFSESTTNETVIQFLEDVMKGNIKAYGGDTFLAKLHRGLYDFFTGFMSFITTSPGIALFVLGIPLAVVSFLVYAICCLDMADEKMDREARRRERAYEKVQRSLRYEFPLEMRGAAGEAAQQLNFSTSEDETNDEKVPEHTEEVISTQPVLRERKTTNVAPDQADIVPHEDKKDN